MVPEGWTEVPLKALLEGHSPGYWGSPVERGGGGVPVLRSTNFRDDGYLDFTDVAFREVPRTKIKQKRLRPGDLLLESSGGGPNKPVGRVVIFEPASEGDYLFSNFLRCLRPRADRADSRFLLYLLWNLHRTGGTKVFQHQTTGIRNLDCKEYLRWEYDVPPLLEQQKIAAILSSVDDVITVTRKVIDQTKRVKQGLLQILMSHGMGHTRFKKTEIGQVPEPWEISSLIELGPDDRPMLKAGPFGSSLKKEYYTTSGYKIYGQEQVLAGDFRFGDYYIDEERYQSLLSCAVRAGDVLVTLVGTPGRTLVLTKEAEPGIINPRLVRFSPSPSLLDPHYLSLWLESPRVQARLAGLSQGGTMDVLNSKMLSSLRIALPALDEQKAIVQRVHQIDSAISTSTACVDRLQSLKRGLMQVLLTGRVRVQPD